MSHIHIPDGVLPISWWVTALIITALLLLFSIRKLEQGDLRKKLPYLGVISALMLITMSVPVGALPFHINLTVLTGILAGPYLGFLAVFIVNLFLSFMGHGGITVIGVNTLILALEVTIGWGVFQLLRRHLKDIPAVAIATFLALVISTTAMLGIVGLSQSGWEYALPHDEAEHYAESTTPVQPADSSAEHQLSELLAEVSFLNISGIFALVLILTIGISLEILATIFIVKFFKKVRPELIG